MERLALPSHLQDVFFDTLWETGDVWALPTPVSTVTLDQLEWQLDLTVWSTVPGQPRFDLSPRVVLASPNAFACHWARIFDADLTYPLELFANRGRWSSSMATTASSSTGSGLVRPSPSGFTLPRFGEQSAQARTPGVSDHKQPFSWPISRRHLDQ